MTHYEGAAALPQVVAAVERLRLPFHQKPHQPKNVRHYNGASTWSIGPEKHPNRDNSKAAEALRLASQPGAIFGPDE